MATEELTYQKIRLDELTPYMVQSRVRVTEARDGKIEGVLESFAFYYDKEGFVHIEMRVSIEQGFRGDMYSADKYLYGDDLSELIEIEVFE